MVLLGAVEKLLTEISIGSSVLPEAETGIGWQSNIQIASRRRLRFEIIVS